jgi:conjugal transfer mating pair stabilization protein TraN
MMGSRPTAVVTAVAFFWMQAWQAGWGDAIQDTARQGQDAGTQVRNAVVLPAVDTQGALTLFPTTPGALSIQSHELFPGSAGGSAEDFKALFGNDAGLVGATRQAQGVLRGEASLTGEAYRAIEGGANRAHPDLSHDPLWGRTDQTMNALDTLAQTFADCTVTTTTQPGSFQAHVPDYRTCERAPRLGTNRCTLSHTVTLNPLPSFTVSVGTWGSVTNTFEFDLKEGAWRSVAPSDGTEFTAQVPVLDPAQVCPATARTRIQFRRATDWPEVPVGGHGEFDDTTDYRVLQTPACDNGLVGRVQLVDPGGPGWYKYAAHFEFEVLQVTGDQWGPDDCLATARLATDGFCTVTTRCTAPPDADGCAVIGGMRLCDHDELVEPAPVPGIDPLCQAVQVEADCPFAYGALRCWTDPQGEPHCPENTAANTARTACETLEQNPACGFIKSECVAGAQGASGTCYVFTDTYDCGSNATVPTQTARSTYRCPGPVRCLGEDCVTPVREQNSDFARAAAAFQAAQAIAADLSCPPPEATQEGHSALQTCQIFKGEAMECKKAVGGQVDCCECPGGVSLADYLILAQAALKLDSALTSLDTSTTAGQSVQGAWTTLRQPIVQTWDTVTDLFTSAAESIGGGVGETAGGAVQPLTSIGIQQTLENAAAELIGTVFGEAARDTIFTASTDAATGVTNYALTGLASTIASALSVIMWIYMIYQIAKILIQMIWTCEKSELEFNAKRELKSCHDVGTYCATEVVGQCLEVRRAACCFASPLSRILQEQIRPQLGLGWGSSRHPDCRGITVEELGRVDWNRVNLDEWLGILAQTGHLPTTRDLSLPGLTGTGNLLDQRTGTRPDTRARTQERLDGINVDGIRNQVGQDLWGNPAP